MSCHSCGSCSSRAKKSSTSARIMVSTRYPWPKRLGPSGHVWAFEPASSTAQFLARGIAENGFGHVTLEQKAMSNAPGSAQLAFHAQAELRSIVHDAAPPGGSEDVSLVTLDDCMDRFRWQDIELIKIDAEGEEANIVQGGRRFFGNLAPLVQYELKSANDLNLDLIRHFAAIGYDSYRLLPGLNLLVPFDAESSPDPYLLNLFCCKAERANRLAARGLLLRSADLAGAGDSLGMTASRDEFCAKYHGDMRLRTFVCRAARAVWELTEKARGKRRCAAGIVVLCTQPRRCLVDGGALSCPRSEFLAIERRCASANLCVCDSRVWRAWRTTTASVPWRSAHSLDWLSPSDRRGQWTRTSRFLPRWSDLIRLLPARLWVTGSSGGLWSNSNAASDYPRFMPVRARLVASRLSMLSDSVVRKWNAALNWCAFALPRRQRRRISGQRCMLSE